MVSPALFSNLVLASRRKRRIAPLPVSSSRSFSPSLRSEPSTEATVVRTSSPLSALGFLFGRWMLGTGSGGYVLGYCPGGYWFGYWFGGYCPGGYCPGGYWPGGYCPVGYWPPEGYCAEATTAHKRTVHTATTAGRKGRRIVKMPPGSILYAFGPGGTPSGRAAHYSFFSAAFTWHFTQLPLVSKAVPAGWWQAPQEVLAVSAVLCMAALKFNGALASCGQFAGWQVLHSFLARLACAVWSYVTLPFLALNTSLVGGFLSWATMDVNATMAKSRKPAKTFRMTAIIRGRRPECHRGLPPDPPAITPFYATRSEEHTSELQSLRHLVCRLL